MYAILPLKRKIEKKIRDLPPAYQGKLEEIFEDIEANPYYNPAGKITQFKGNRKHEGWHYDLSRSLRVHYSVDDNNKTVQITYIGAHT